MSAWRAALVLALTLAFGASPLWVPDIGGFEPDRFPIPQDDPPVQPKGYAFAIWGIIYVWLIVGAGFGLLRRGTDAGWDRMRTPLALSLAGRYAGWRSAASCGAIGLLLGGDGFLSEDLAALLMIAIAAALAYGVQTRLPHVPTYGIAAIWALVGIVVQNGLVSMAGLVALCAAFILLLPTTKGARGL